MSIPGRGRADDLPDQVPQVKPGHQAWLPQMALRYNAPHARPPLAQASLARPEIHRPWLDFLQEETRLAAHSHPVRVRCIAAALAECASEWRNTLLTSQGFDVSVRLFYTGMVAMHAEYYSQMGSKVGLTDATDRTDASHEFLKVDKEKTVAPPPSVISLPCLLSLSGAVGANLGGAAEEAAIDGGHGSRDARSGNTVSASSIAALTACA